MASILTKSTTRFEPIVGWTSGTYTRNIRGPFSRRIKAISAGQLSIALGEDGTLFDFGGFEWSANQYIEYLCPVGQGHKFVHASIDTWWAVAIKADGSLVQWGDLNVLPTTNNDQIHIINPPEGTDFIAAAAGYNWGVALHADGTLEFWGSVTGSDYGQDHVPSPDSGHYFIAVGAGELHGAALQDDGVIKCWGWNADAQATPPVNDPQNPFTKIAVGHRHNLALREDGSVVGWGANGSGETTCPSGNSFVKISAGYQNSLALRKNGTLIGWGYGYGSQTINPPAYTNCENIAGGLNFHLVRRTNDYVRQWPPISADWVAYAKIIACGGNHALAIQTDDTLYCWGDNTYGQAPYPAAEGTFLKVAAGLNFSLAIKTDGTILAFGDNSEGQLDVVINALYPVFRDIAAGWYHSVALRYHSGKNGEIAGWGCNNNGQLDFELSDLLVCEFIAVTAGELHTAAIRAPSESPATQGSIQCWGDNTYGQLNHPTGSNFVKIVAGARHTLALDATGKLWAWGDNSEGQCDCPAGTNFTDIAAGGNTSLAIQHLGAGNDIVVQWGNIGPAATVPKGTNFVDIASGYSQKLAVKAVNTVRTVTSNGIEFDADATMNTLTTISKICRNGDIVRVSNIGGELPAPLQKGVDYYTRDVSAYIANTGYTCKLAGAMGDTAIDLTTAGTGTNFIIPRQRKPLLKVARCRTDYTGTIKVTFHDIIISPAIDGYAWADPLNPRGPFPGPPPSPNDIEFVLTRQWDWLDAAARGYQDSESYKFIWGIDPWYGQAGTSYLATFMFGNHYNGAGSYPNVIGNGGTLFLQLWPYDGIWNLDLLVFETHTLNHNYRYERVPETWSDKTMRGYPAVDVNNGRRSWFDGGRHRDVISTRIANTLRKKDFTDPELGGYFWGPAAPIGWGGYAEIDGKGTGGNGLFYKEFGVDA